MPARPDDRLLKSRGEEKATASLSDLTFPDENDVSVGSGPTGGSRTPPVSGKEGQKADAAIRFEDMDELIDEKSSDFFSVNAKADARPVSGYVKPNDPAANLHVEPEDDEELMDFMVGMDAGEGEVFPEAVENLEDEHEYVDIFDTSEDDTHIGNVTQNSHEHEGSPYSASDRIIESAERNDVNSSIQNEAPSGGFFAGGSEGKASGEEALAESLRTLEKELPTSKVVAESLAGESREERSAPRLSPDPISDDVAHVSEPSLSQAPRTGIGAILGVLAMVGAGGALWMGVDMSERVANLEMQLAAKAPAYEMPDQGAEIASLSRRLDELSGQFAAHLKQGVQTSQSEPVMATTPIVETTAPVTEAITPATELTAPIVATVATQEEVSVPATEPLPVVAAAKPVAEPDAPVQESKSIKLDAAVLDGNRSVDGSQWVVNLSSFSTPASADTELARIKSLGIHAETIKAVVDGRIWYRIRVPGFANAESARSQLKILESKVKISDAWIGMR